MLLTIQLEENLMRAPSPRSGINWHVPLSQWARPAKVAASATLNLADIAQSLCYLGER